MELEMALAKAERGCPHPTSTGVCPTCLLQLIREIRRVAVQDFADESERRLRDLPGANAPAAIEVVQELLDETLSEFAEDQHAQAPAA